MTVTIPTWLRRPDSRIHHDGIVKLTKNQLVDPRCGICRPGDGRLDGPARRQRPNPTTTRAERRGRWTT